MKISIKVFITSVAVLCTCNYSIGQDSCQVKLVKEYTEKYSGSYTLSKKEELLGKEILNDYSTIHFRDKGLKRVTSLVFASRKQIAAYTRLGFIATIYQYTSNSDASEKFKELATVKQTHDEAILSKDWNYLVLSQNFILRIQGDCSYSEENWNNLKDIFTKANIKVMGKAGKDIIQCQCGGYCY